MPNNEFGDFQTPIVLATQCLKTLKLPSHARILEPTCGAGSFLQAAADIAPRSERMGVEINPDYAKKASAWGKVQHRNVFELELSSPIWGNTDAERGPRSRRGRYLPGCVRPYPSWAGRNRPRSISVPPSDLVSIIRTRV